MSKMSEKMYGSSPKMERDEEDGKVKVKKKAMDKDTTGEAEDKGDGQDVPMEARHTMERAEMHMKHQREHHMHGGSEKKEMHSRHEDEMKMLHKKHEKEMGSEKK